MSRFPSLPIVAAAFLLGICSPIWITCPLSAASILIILAFSAILLIVAPNNILRFIIIVILGFAYMVFNINQHVHRTLNPNLEAKMTNVSGMIVSVPERNAENTAKFLFKVESIDNSTIETQLPILAQINWKAAPKKIAPGDEWEFQVKLKRPRNFANPGSFDSEKFYFQQRISAIGSVLPKTKPKFITSNPLSQPVNRIRQHVLTFITKNIGERAYVGIVTALVLGTKSLISQQQWQILQNTGTAHLMAISGMHIGLVAGAVFFVIKLLWRFVPRRFLTIPAPFAAACLSLIVSISYALLAGFTIATQRALIMLATFMLGILLRRNIPLLQRYCLALLLVLLWDPFAVISAGFWLSFLAVGSLLYACSGHFTGVDQKTRNSVWFKLQNWLRPQLVISIALIPVSLIYFAQCSIIGPLANLLAIPWVTIFVVPLSLCATVAIYFDHTLATELFTLSDHCCALLWPFLEYCNRFPVYIWSAPSKYFVLSMICAAIGVIWLFVPKGIPGRLWGILGFVPLFFAHQTTIPVGQADFALLDVGQGLSAIVRTQNYTLVYDTGAKTSNEFDFGSKVVAPYLQTLGVKKIDTLVISHVDNDHIGGALGLLDRYTADQILLNDTDFLPTYNKLPCIADQSWTWDDVKFTILHPASGYYTKKRNDQSCVLLVQAGNHKILLTGDIEKKSEQVLIENYGDQLISDILLVPHHGSKTSSSEEFVQQVRPKYALVPAGYKNQYGHPKQLILDRYNEQQITILRTDLDGAISFRLGMDGSNILEPNLYRKTHKNFWSAIN